MNKLLPALRGVFVLGLLVRTNRRLAGEDRSAVVSRSVVALMAVAAATLLVASSIHFGVTAPLGVNDVFRGAAIPEAVLGVLLGLAAAFVVSGRPGSREMALATTVFTLLLSLYGFSVTLRSGLTGDVAYHISLLVLLAAIIAGLLRRGRSARAATASAASSSVTTM